MERNFGKESQCPLCTPAVDFSNASAHRVLEHNAGHILFDDRINITDQPCRLCLRPSPACTFYLKKGKGGKSSVQLDMKKSSCANKLTFQYAVAEESSQSAPCSNVPTACPLCPERSAPAVWRYLLPYHLKDVHKLNNLEPYAHLWTITQSEKTQLKNIWNEKHTMKRTRKSKKKTGFKISDAHCSRLALR